METCRSQAGRPAPTACVSSSTVRRRHTTSAPPWPQRSPPPATPSSPNGTGGRPADGISPCGPPRSSRGTPGVALQPYGGAWLNSWLDRDLGVSGRLSVRERGSVAQRLVCIDSPVLRVPQLAIHLAEDRKSVTLDPQRHVNAVWGVGNGARSF